MRRRLVCRYSAKVSIYYLKGIYVPAFPSLGGYPNSRISHSPIGKIVNQLITIRPLLVFTVGYLLSAPLGFGASIRRFDYPRFQLGFLIQRIASLSGASFIIGRGRTRLIVYCFCDSERFAISASYSFTRLRAKSLSRVPPSATIRRASTRRLLSVTDERSLASGFSP